MLATYDVGLESIASAITRGVQRASSVDDWIQLAIAFHQLAIDHGAARNCMNEASRLAESTHARVIDLARARLGELVSPDDERPRLLPGQLLRPGARCVGWTRDPARLLGWIRARIPDVYVDAVSPVPADAATLRAIWKTGSVPHPLPDFVRGLRETRVHPLAGAFVCTLLCLDEGDRHTDTLAVLLDACLQLDHSAVEAAAALFAALADSYEARGIASARYSTTNVAYLVLFAELALVLAAASLDPTDPRIDGVIARLVRDEPRYRARCPAMSQHWLTGFVGHGRERWCALAERIIVHARHRELLRLLNS